MSDTSEKKWKPALTKVLAELDNKQYRETMECLDKIPRSQKKGRSEATMAQRIIECYGHNESISVMHDIMEEIPRKDPKMQDLLGPFVEELRSKNEKGRKGKKRKCDPEEKEDDPPAEMSDTAEKKWKATLTKILEELDIKQYRETMEYLDKIPGGQKKGRSEATMAQKIIERYGHNDSISAIHDIMEEIPRKDPRMQELLGPFVEELRNKNKKGRKGKKRKCDPEEKEDDPPAGKKKKCVPVEKKKKPAEAQKSSQPVKERNTDRWKKSIRELKTSSSLLDTDGIVGKVIQKSGVRSYRTKDNIKRFFFFLAVADETASIKLMVYGKPFYKQIMEEKTYTFRKLTKDEKGFVKLRARSEFSKKRKPVQVPDKLEKEARELIYPKSPDYSISDAKLSAGIRVTVKGTITKVQSADSQSERIRIEGIAKATKKETQLDAVFRGRMHRCVVASRLLAKAFGIKLEGDIKEKLLDIIPMSADAVIQGGQIKELTAAPVK